MSSFIAALASLFYNLKGPDPKDYQGEDKHGFKKATYLINLSIHYSLVSLITSAIGLVFVAIFPFSDFVITIEYLLIGICCSCWAVALMLYLWVVFSGSEKDYVITAPNENDLNEYNKIGAINDGLSIEDFLRNRMTYIIYKYRDEVVGINTEPWYDKIDFWDDDWDSFNSKINRIFEYKLFNRNYMDYIYEERKKYDSQA